MQVAVGLTLVPVSHELGFTPVIRLHPAYATVTSSYPADPDCPDLQERCVRPILRTHVRSIHSFFPDCCTYFVTARSENEYVVVFDTLYIGMHFLIPCICPTVGHCMLASRQAA
jgi:hypothetical protein